MQIRNKYYPYPVIVEGGDYYVDSEFSSIVEQSMEGYNVKLVFKTLLKNPELEELVKKGIVEIVHHIECPQTCFRKIIKTREYERSYLLKDTDVNGIVQICSFLIAAEDINKYCNNSFSNDYKGFKFNIEKGCIMAVGNQYNLRINKIRDDLSNTSSIFSIVPNKDDMENNMMVILEQQKIIIKLPEKTHRQYLLIKDGLSEQPIMHSMLIVPALIYTFSELRADGEQLFLREENRWFRSLKKACEAIGIILNEETLHNMDILKVSQQLLNSPIAQAFENYSTGGGSYED